MSSADIVERLRERAQSYRASSPSAEHTASLLDEAADMIERLQSGRGYNWRRLLRARASLTEALNNAQEDFAREVVNEVQRRVDSFQLGVSSVSKSAVLAIVREAAKTVKGKAVR